LGALRRSEGEKCGEVLMNTKLQNQSKMVAACGLMAIGVFATGWMLGSVSRGSVIGQAESRSTATVASRGAGGHSDLVNGKKVKQSDPVDPTLLVGELAVTEGALYEG